MYIYEYSIEISQLAWRRRLLVWTVLVTVETTCVSKIIFQCCTVTPILQLFFVTFSNILYLPLISFSLFLSPFLSLLLISFSCPSLLSLFLTFSLPGHGPWLLHFSDMQFPEVKVQVQKTAHRANAQLWRCEYHGGKWHDSIALCSFGEQKKWLNLSKEV